MACLTDPLHVNANAGMFYNKDCAAGVDQLIQSRKGGEAEFLLAEPQCAQLLTHTSTHRLSALGILDWSHLPFALAAEVQLIFP